MSYKRIIIVYSSFIITFCNNNLTNSCCWLGWLSWSNESPYTTTTHASTFVILPVLRVRPRFRHEDKDFLLFTGNIHKFLHNLHNIHAQYNTHTIISINHAAAPSLSSVSARAHWHLAIWQCQCESYP